MTREQQMHFNADAQKKAQEGMFKREARMESIRIAARNHAVNTQPTLEEAAEKIYQWLIKDLE